MEGASKDFYNSGTRATTPHWSPLRCDANFRNQHSGEYCFFVSIIKNPLSRIPISESLYLWHFTSAWEIKKNNMNCKDDSIILSTRQSPDVQFTAMGGVRVASCHPWQFTCSEDIGQFLDCSHFDSTIPVRQTQWEMSMPRSPASCPLATISHFRTRI